MRNVPNTDYVVAAVTYPNSRVYENAWRTCFSAEKPVGKYWGEFRFSFAALQVRANHAKRDYRIRPHNTVSSFSSWIHHLYARVTREQLYEGKLGEEAYAMSIDAARRHSVNRWRPRAWKEVYCGIGEKSKEQSFQISSLTLNGQPFFGSPDFVFRNAKTDEILILEVKTLSDYRRVDPRGWPDLRAQLWAYSFIDDFQDASKIRTSALIITPTHKGDCYVKQRAMLPFCFPDSAWHDQNLILFRIYGGEFESLVHD